MVKILVTGGAGFIGSHLVDGYIAHGHRVVVIDNLSHGRRRQVHPRATFYKTDIRNGPALRRILQRERPTVVNHHAALSTVVASMRAPQLTLAHNVMGTAELLQALSAFKIQKFIFASTGGTIYGNTRQLPTPETAPLEPISMYALSKQMGEELVRYYAKIYHWPYVILRYGNVFGIRQDPHGEASVVAIFSELLAHGRPVTFFGDGTKTRDYVYIEDVVEANRLAIRQGHDHILNIGRGRQISDLTVYQTIQEYFPKVQAPRYQPIRPGEVLHGALRCAAAQRVLGWKARWTFAAGVHNYLTRMYAL